MHAAHARMLLAVAWLAAAVPAARAQDSPPAAAGDGPGEGGPDARAAPVSLAERVAARAGEAVMVHWLDGGAGRFLALERWPLDVAAKGTLFLLPGTGQHADWPDVIGPLARALPEHGWRTVAVDRSGVPAAAGGEPGAARDPNGVARLRIALQELASAEAPFAAVLAYGSGAPPALACLAGQAAGVRTLVLVSGRYPEDAAAAGFASRLAAVGLPVLDVLGGRDPAAVRRRARAHRTSATRQGIGLEQRLLDTAGQRYAGAEAELAGLVRGWLERQRRGLRAGARRARRPP